jgi:hypothetical protein
MNISKLKPGQCRRCNREVAKGKTLCSFHLEYAARRMQCKRGQSRPYRARNFSKP